MLTDELSEVRCGWPVWTSSWVRLLCALDLGHDHPECRAVEDGRVVAAIPRLGTPAGVGG